MKFVLATTFLLSGCSGQWSFGPQGPSVLAAPPNTRVIAEPNGTIIEEPAEPPIQTLITGLSQAQAVRTYVRQLAH